MHDQNGKNPENMSNHPSKIFEKPFKEIPFYTITEKLRKNELSIEDILSSNECIEDLKYNPNSKYKKILTTKNIIKLISLCIYPSDPNIIITYNTLRYPYYSCELLCSPSILQFSKSTQSILKANDRQNKIREKEEYKEEENDLNFNEKDNNENNIQEDIFSQEEQKQEERNENKFEDFFADSKGIDNEQFMNFNKRQETESEIQNETMINNKKTHFEEKENVIIKEIMKEIFGFLKQKINLDETCVGYFQKLVNYLLINEPKITTDYLFNENHFIVRKFYYHMNNASIENIFENILNYISDQENKEDNLDNSKFNLIIMELLDEIGCIINKEYDNNDNINYINDKNKIEFISELIINTLINNTEKHLIKLIFSSSGNFMKKIIFLIEKSANLEYKKEKNNKKSLIINILEIAQEINIIIMNSKNLIIKNDYKDDVIFFSDFYKKIKTFENQYFCKKSINIENIYKSFEKNKDLYISSIKKIYELIKNDIIKNTNLNNDNKKEKGIALMLLSEWKFILSGLKIFIFQFYAFEDFKSEFDNNNKDFYDEKLFDLSSKLFFISGENNLYQNIFVDIIKLLNFELVPNYFIKYFCKKHKSFIKKIKEINEKKEENTNILLGPYIQILLLFYTSRNPYLNQYYNDEKNKNEKEIKDKFIYLIKPKFERKFDENYEYTEDEIFSNNNDSIDTFDGNDINNNSKIKYESFKTIINNYFEKINQINNNSNNKMSDQNSNQNQATKTDTNITEKNIGENTTLEESKTVEQSDNSGENVPGISAKTTFRFK
jgi:hypothetical protein